MELVTKSFENQCLAFPTRVDQMLARIETVEEAKGLLDQAATMRHYAERLKAGVDVERPIAIGVLKIKAKLGELMPAVNGRPKKGAENPKAALGFSEPTVSAYRKLATNAEKLEEYYEATDDVPTQTDFLKYVANGSIIATKHGNGIVDWYTPEEYVSRVRKVMGSIDVDPATSTCAQDIVKAKTAYTAEDDGLAHEWRGTVFLNPPYKMPDVAKFVNKLCDHIENGTVSQAILLTNNNTDTDWWQRAAEVATAVCLTDGRIKFYNAIGDESSPTNGQSFCYFGGREATFRKTFSDVGIILCKK